MKPRIAFCFSGQARTLDLTLPYIVENLFEAAKNQGFEYDTFCAVEDDPDRAKIDPLKPTSIEKIKSSEVKHIIEKRYGDFITHHINKDIYLSQLLNYKFENGLQQFYKIWRSDLLRQEQEKKMGKKYDIVFRLRFDVIFFDTLDFEKILETIEKEDGLLVNFAPTKGNNTIFDLNILGGSDRMTEYAHIFEEVERGFVETPLSFFQKTLLFLVHPIFLLRSFLEKHCKRNSPLYHVWNLAYSGFALFLEKISVPVYSFEKILYTYLIYKKIPLINSKINYILLRKSPEESICKYFENGEFIK